jgi:hypothetical protein
MNDAPLNPEDLKLRERLQTARPSPALPPRFGEHVWRRIEAADAPVGITREPVWLESLVALILRPRFAFATAALLVIAGGLLGTRGGADFARKDAQARYVAAVAPHALH